MIDINVVIMIYGFVLLIKSLKFLKDPKEASLIAKEVASSHALAYVSGMRPLVLGAVTIFAFGPVVHVGHLELLVFVLGLILTLIGIFRLWFAHAYADMMKKHAESSHFHLLMGVLFVVSILLLLIGSGVIMLK